MGTWPVLISIPHSGQKVPPEVAGLNLLGFSDILQDGDFEGQQIYDLKHRVRHLIAASVARAYVDLNRSVNDRGADGVIKKVTWWNAPVYRREPSSALKKMMIEKYHTPYHNMLSTMASDVVISLDCHTMLEAGPAIGPGAGTPRPWVCISDGGGTTCPPEISRALFNSFRKAVPGPVGYNDPFAGGYITRFHGKKHPWIQIEITRSDVAPVTAKHQWVKNALKLFFKSFSACPKT